MSQQQEGTVNDSQSWKEVVYRRLQERNQKESLPFQHIYQHHQQLLQNYAKLEGQRDSAKHSLKLLEYETMDMMSRKDADAKAVVAFFKQKVAGIQKDLSSTATPSHENLSKIIYDQRKIMMNQVEEMSVVKSELQNSLAELATVKAAHAPCTDQLAYQEQQLMELKAMMQSMEDLVTQLKHENKSLTERLISEKEHSAKQMNDINALLEGKH